MTSSFAPNSCAAQPSEASNQTLHSYPTPKLPFHQVVPNQSSEQVEPPSTSPQADQAAFPGTLFFQTQME
ncbi:hypothetical protein F8388_025790 [Cannabis sativa]|uniref:Uncharacterized protein n=1 Tax=Cannabis sativa TaxID=3483 RepID=A0A7J6F9L2_CANSA|nr:hypothetical protein F8388_025790 [Cannabis sativa]